MDAHKFLPTFFNARNVHGRACAALPLDGAEFARELEQD
jgi:hypothetical protein